MIFRCRFAPFRIESSGVMGQMPNIRILSLE